MHLSFIVADPLDVEADALILTADGDSERMVGSNAGRLSKRLGEELWEGTIYRWADSIGTRFLACHDLEALPRCRLASHFAATSQLDGVPMQNIDGRDVAWEELGRMRMSCEGWQFRLEIKDPSDEV